MYCFSLAIRNGGAGKELPDSVAAALKLESGVRNPETETESRKQKQNTKY